MASARIGVSPDGWTSADAAGPPILPGLVRYEEVASGVVAHAVRFTAPRTQRAYLWPARHFANSSTDPGLPPMGAWFRLKPSVDPADFSPQTRPIVRALQRHGMILADNGSPWFLSGATDPRWDNDILRELRTLSGTDFESVDTASLPIDPDSAQIPWSAASLGSWPDQPWRGDSPGERPSRGNRAPLRYFYGGESRAPGDDPQTGRDRLRKRPTRTSAFGPEAERRP